ncbi:MAG TPA: hypothetical protein DHW14_06200 [Clostridiales bacterium]|nr:hypothetical protein [Clostridiales bacterium]
MLRRLAVVVLIVFVVLAALSELVLPGILARSVEAALEATFGPPAEHDVRLASRPAVKMLLGRFDEVEVTSTNVQTSTLVLESLAVTLHDASVDLKALLSEGELEVSRSARSRVTITITERNLEEYLAANVPEFREPRVLITSDVAAFSGYVTVLGRDFVFTLSGRFVLRDESTVGFDITGFTVDDVGVPGEFLEKWLDVLGEPDLSIDLAGFPLPLKGTEVTQEEGRVIIEATAD